MPTDYTSLSRFLSLILRHKPETVGISLDSQGWTNVEELITAINKQQPFTQEVLEEIVATDSKQRYTFNEDKTLIRANQGHSVPVDLGLTPVTPPDYLYHGTAEKYISSIEEQGLLPKSRQYVHLSIDLTTAKQVGARHGDPVVISIAAKQMHEDGYQFYLSKNNVWLTERVPAKYLIMKYTLKEEQ